jgi:hypothetical protein
MLPIPDQLAVLVELFYAVQRDAVQYTIVIDQIEGEMIVGLEENLPQRDANQAMFYSVIVSDKEITAAKLLVPAYAIE